MYWFFLQTESGYQRLNIWDCIPYSAKKIPTDEGLPVKLLLARVYGIKPKITIYRN